MAARACRRVAAALVLLVLAALVAQTTSAAPSGRFVLRGTVTYVVDGDTVDVRLADGTRERVRVLGIDTPERGACHFAQATSRTRSLALGKAVVLRGDPTQDTRDRYGRLLSTVWLPGGKDLGYQLVAGGFAKVYVFRSAFQRLPAYRAAEQVAQQAPRGLWRSCRTAKPVVPQPAIPPPARDCHPSYSPCLPIVADLDCADVHALGQAPVRVKGTDSYRLDGDGDGWGCE